MLDDTGDMFKFSVLMSLYIKERPEYLDACFDSLYKQSHQADEIVLVLDGPVTSELHKVIDSWEPILPLCIYQLEENVGLGCALNFGLSKCTYDFVARMDTDDICMPERFHIQIEAFLRDPDLTICGASIKEVDAVSLEFISNRNVPQFDYDIKRYLPKRSPFNHMTVMYKKHEVINCGSYKHLPLMEDWYLWCRLLSPKAKGYNVQQQLVVARTGLSMIERRSGFNYVKSEWLMHKYRMELKISSLTSSFFIFFLRSIVRLLPSKIVKSVYWIIRKV
ncbi:MAG: glycosyltransferase [Vibrio sp.]